MKYKVGDKVTIKKDLKFDEGNKKTRAITGMLEYAGESFTIKSVEEWADGYRLEGVSFYWTDEMFEEPIPEPEVKTTAKHKVGHKVKIRKDLKPDRSNPKLVVTKDMVKYAGQIVTIDYVDTDETYAVKENTWWWSDELFEAPKTVKPKRLKLHETVENGIRFLTIGDYTIAIPDDIAVGIARKNPEDEWNTTKGRVVAVINGLEKLIDKTVDKLR